MKNLQCLSSRECMRKKLRPAPAGRGQVKPSLSLNKTFFKWSACLRAEQSLNQDWAAKGQGMWSHRYQVLSPTSVIYPGSICPQAEPGFLANMSAEFPGQLWSWPTQQRHDWRRGDSVLWRAGLGGDSQVFLKTTCGIKVFLGSNCSLHLGLPFVVFILV